MKLYLVHCGFYDQDLMDGLYESHANFYVVAGNFEEARAKAKLHADYKKHKMHIDGLQEIQIVDGYKIELTKAASEYAGRDVVVSSRHRELAPAKPTPHG